VYSVVCATQYVPKVRVDETAVPISQQSVITVQPGEVSTMNSLVSGQLPESTSVLESGKIAVVARDLFNNTVAPVELEVPFVLSFNSTRKNATYTFLPSKMFQATWGPLNVSGPFSVSVSRGGVSLANLNRSQVLVNPGA
jgi:hypothetical protein